MCASINPACTACARGVERCLTIIVSAVQGKDGNIRALLASLDTVLWDGSGWKKPSMTDLVDPKRVKRAYMMANLVVHPDKVKQKGGTVEQIVVADIAFDTLKSAWSKFESGELRG